MIVSTDGKTPMFETMFSMACTYSSSSGVLKSKIKEEDKYEFFFPSVVCSAFSIELFLKFFHLIDFPEVFTKNDFNKFNINIRAHTFSVLWDSLNASYKEEIVGQFRRVGGFARDANEFRRVLVEELGDNPFVKWRYIHEEDEGHYWMNLDLVGYVNDAFGHCAQKHYNLRKANHQSKL
jgi:hypothetical protein